MTVTVWTPYCTATINGDQIDPAIVRGARVESSFGDPVTKGYVKCTDTPGWSHGDEVTITLGNGYNNLTRFRGNVYEGDSLNTGPNFELVARGPMWRVSKYRNSNPKGLTLLDLTGGPATDEAIARAVLDVVGVDYSSGNIGGTGITRGETAAVAYTWKFGETALAYLQRLSKASLGYAAVESVGPDVGQIFRTRILSTPSGGSDLTFTQGVDIFEGAHQQDSSFEQYSAWGVTGFDYGDGEGPVGVSSPDPIPDGVEPYSFSSEMIEKALTADPGNGISAQQVIDYIANETNHPVRTLSGFSTPRDDLIGPGQVHTVNSAMLGGSRQYMVRGVTIEVDDQWFTQTLVYVG